jgi:hypothetical protein
MIQYKTKKIQEASPAMHPIMHEVMGEMSDWLIKNYNLDLSISETTTTLSMDQALKRVSATHREGRAFDIGGVYAWNKEMLTNFATYFNDKYKQLGALSHSGIRTFLLVHDSGHGLHCHVQIGRDIVDQMKKKYPLWNYPIEKKRKHNG